MSSRDKQIGQALTRMRGEKSQQWVADSMRERGWKWAQATVWNIEKGERPLRLAEAEDLANVLGCTVAHFMFDERESQFVELANRAGKAHEGLRAAVNEFVDAQFDLAGAADDLGVEDWDQAVVDGWLKHTPAEVVADELFVRGSDIREEMARGIEDSPSIKAGIEMADGTRRGRISARYALGSPDAVPFEV